VPIDRKESNVSYAGSTVPAMENAGSSKARLGSSSHWISAASPSSRRRRSISNRSV
jgi:hypothetical protein